MKHFYQSIIGCLHHETKKLYIEMVSKAKDGDHFVEVGCFYGRSTAFLAVEIINSGKNIKLDCVDHWKGSKEQQNMDLKNLYNDFLKNMAPVRHVINPIISDSIDASKLYQDESIDFVFIDASHELKDVKKDIISYLPKVKIGGILAGDDYPFYGVAQALFEVFAHDFIISYQIKDTCWILPKNKEFNSK